MSASFRARTHFHIVPDWLLISIVASVVLTLAANLVLPLMRRPETRFLERMEDHVRPGRRMRVVFPWKTMIVVSVLGTLALNIFS